MAKFKGVARDRKFARKWIEALENGKFKGTNFHQTKGTLVRYRWDNDERVVYGANNPSMCCLGVACFCDGKPFTEFVGHDTLAQFTDTKEKLGLDIDPADLPDAIQERFKFRNKEALEEYFIGLNDSSKLTFKQIAARARVLLLGEVAA